MKIQMTISEDQDIKIALDVDTSDEESIPENETAMVICRRNWPQFIIFSQVVDSNGYGCHFPMIPHFNKNNTAGRILWSLSEMLTKIPILWELTTNVLIDCHNGMDGYCPTYLLDHFLP